MENKYKLIIFPSAQNDMERIFKYISKNLHNPSAANKQTNDFEQALDNVCIFPNSFPYVNNEYVKDKSIHKLIVNNYIVFYRRENKEVQVVRVLFSMRDYNKII